MARRQRSDAAPSEQEGLLEDPEFLRGALQRHLQQFLEDEIGHFLQAAPYERTGERQGYRNCYKPRQLTTRVGRLELALPQDREGRFHSELSARYQRSEKAPLLLALQQSYLQGVSTRKVKAITEKLCGTHFSKSLVSSVCQQLDTEIQTWLRRPLIQPYPYLVVDARYEHVREKHRVVSKGVLLVQGVGQDGHRDLLTVGHRPHRGCAPPMPSSASTARLLEGPPWSRSSPTSWPACVWSRPWPWSGPRSGPPERDTSTSNY